ncbi:MAG: aminopeptidase [Eggerthellaceae bacterium]
MERKIAWEAYSADQLEELESLSARYIDFISDNKTERQCFASSVAQAEAAGYVPLEKVVQENGSLAPGDKVWAGIHGKTLVLVHIGEEPLEQGLNILGAHIDSPRLDLKQNPLYESDGFAYLDTHYYGGIKHYQWVTLPLALHGVVAKTDGSVVDINIGDDAGDPVFCVTDLLPHLGSKQMSKKGSEVVEGESLDILMGNRPLVVNTAEDASADGSEKEAAPKDKVKAFALELLEEKYGIAEEDFLSAEIEVVPAGRARELGFDRSMVIGYGQDDRVCAYTSLEAQLALNETPRTTAVTVLVDKEEIGSVGATGMASLFFENTIAEVLGCMGAQGDLPLRRTLAASRMLSSDVSAAYDPAYASVYETKNAAYAGKGLVFNKYTGARGKSGSNDARAEYMAYIRRVMDDADVAFQTAELGRVDAGGGGTIAYIPAKYGMDVIDSGVAVLSMHSPWEVTSKADIYEAYRGYVAFLKAC